MPATTFPEVLADRLRRAASRPAVTSYDEESGERVELSGTTYANWVAKTANLLVDELGLDAGDRLLLDLPPHWLGAVFLGAAWSAGLAVTTDPAETVDAVVCGPGPGTYAGARVPVVATALLPFAVPARPPYAAPVIDYGLAWPGQPDVFVPPEPVTAETVAWTDGTTQGALIARASAAGRLLTDLSPLTGHGVPALLGPLLGDGLVLVVHPRDAQWPARHDDERATGVLRA